MRQRRRISPVSDAMTAEILVAACYPPGVGDCTRVVYVCLPVGDTKRTAAQRTLGPEDPAKPLQMETLDTGRPELSQGVALMHHRARAKTSQTLRSPRNRGPAFLLSLRSPSGGRPIRAHGPRGGWTEKRSRRMGPSQKEKEKFTRYGQRKAGQYWSSRLEQQETEGDVDPAGTSELQALAPETVFVARITTDTFFPSVADDIAVWATCQTEIRKQARPGDFVILYASNEYLQLHNLPLGDGLRDGIVFIGLVAGFMLVTTYMGTRSTGTRADQTGFWRTLREGTTATEQVQVTDWASNPGDMYHRIWEWHDYHSQGQIAKVIQGENALIFRSYAFFGIPRLLSGVHTHFPPLPLEGHTYYPKLGTTRKDIAEGKACLLMALGAGIFANQGRHNDSRTVPNHLRERANELLDNSMPSWSQMSNAAAAAQEPSCAKESQGEEASDGAGSVLSKSLRRRKRKQRALLRQNQVNAHHPGATRTTGPQIPSITTDQRVDLEDQQQLRAPETDMATPHACTETHHHLTPVLQTCPLPQPNQGRGGVLWV